MLKQTMAALDASRIKMRKGIVGNKRNAEINVVNVKPQSRKNCEVNRGESDAEEESADVIRRCSFEILP